MPNKNYQSGRRFEYETMATWREKGYEVIRASGSHGSYDIVAYKLDRHPEFIQCKSTASPTVARGLLKKFKETTLPSSHYHQTLTIRLKGNRAPITVTI